MLGAESTAESVRVLRELDPSKLRVGSALPGAIRSADGRVLLCAGKILVPRDLDRLERRTVRGIFGGQDWPDACCRSWREPEQSHTASDQSEAPNGASPNGDNGESISVAEPAGALVPTSVDCLEPGTRLECDLFSSAGAMLLPAGSEVTQHFLEKLRMHQIFEVHLARPVDQTSKPTTTPRDDAAPREVEKRSDSRPQITTDVTLGWAESYTTRQLDRITESEAYPDIPRAGRTAPRPRLQLDDLRTETERASEDYDAAVDHVGEIITDVYRGKPSSITALRQVVARFLNAAQMDSGILPAIVNMENSSGEYLFRHGLNVALLSMNLATELALRGEHVLEIGLGAFLQDIGMLCVPQELRLAPRKLTEDEQLEIKRHPIYSVNLLEKMPGVGDVSLLIAYQSHERPDRSGYPKKRHRTLIHPYARIVAAVDAYSALACHRPHREGRSPYEAMEVLVKEASQDHFDRQVIRTYLDCMSLFPVGSHVRLSNGLTARVLRANPGLHTKPVVLPLNEDGSESNIQLDLASAENAHVVQALGSEHELSS